MQKEFSLAITGDENPEDSVLLSRLKEALKKDTKKINIINGYVVDTKSNVRMTVGPVLGEITDNYALMMIEVVGEQNIIPICAKLYKGNEKGEPITCLEKELKAKRATIFEFNDLEPNTEYTGKFNF